MLEDALHSAVNVNSIDAFVSTYNMNSSLVNRRASVKLLTPLFTLAHFVINSSFTAYFEGSELGHLPNNCEDF